MYCFADIREEKVDVWGRSSSIAESSRGRMKEICQIRRLERRARRVEMGGGAGKV